MKIKPTTVRTWLSGIMVIVMLFCQSAVVWANVITQTHGQHMQRELIIANETNRMATTHKHNHCQQYCSNCSEHAQDCTDSCSSLCFVTGISMLPNTVANLVPHYDIKLINQSSISPLHGIYPSTIERPPQQRI